MLNRPIEHKFRNYFLVLMVLFYNSSPFFSLITFQYWCFLIIILIFYVDKTKFFNATIFLIISLVLLLSIIQSFFYGGLSIALFYKPFLLFFTPYLLYRIMGISYYKYLVNLIYYLAILSIFLWLFQNIFQYFFINLANQLSVYSWDVTKSSLLFYTVESTPISGGINLTRNSGPFHEPGAFSIYLILAILMNTLYSKKFYDKKNIILILVMISTFSTTGFILLSIFILYTIIKSNINIIFKIFSYTIFSLSIFILYRDSPFLSEKIEDQYRSESYRFRTGDEYSRGRFFSFLQSANLVLKNPIIGQGIIEKTKHSEIKSEYMVGYGFIGFFMNYGVILGISYLIFFYLGIVKFCNIFLFSRQYAIIVFIILQLALLSQGFFLHLSFSLFFIIGLYRKESNPLDILRSSEGNVTYLNYTYVQEGKNNYFDRF